MNVLQVSTCYRLQFVILFQVLSLGCFVVYLGECCCVLILKSSDKLGLTDSALS